MTLDEARELANELLTEGYGYECVVDNLVAEFGLSKHEARLITTEELKKKKRGKNDYTNFGGVF